MILKLLNHPDSLHSLGFTGFFSKVSPKHLMNFMIISMTFVMLFLSLKLTALQAQNLIIDQISQTVEVKRENLDQAKKEALGKGKRRLVENAMARFLDADSMVILKKVLEKHILEDTDSLIDSIRVIEEETSLDRSKFKINLEGRIFRSRLLMKLRPLGLMTQSKSSPPQKVRLVYETDMQLRNSKEMKLFRTELQKRLNPYWINIGSLVKWERSLDPKSLGAYFRESKNLDAEQSKSKRDPKNLAVNQVPLVISLRLIPDSGNLSSDQGKAAIMMLNPGDPRQTRLDLIEWVSPNDRRPPYEHLARVGINRIALWTVGLDDEYERLKADGVDFLSEPLFMGGHTKFVCFRDPDGTIIELIEFHRSPSGEELAQPAPTVA